MKKIKIISLLFFFGFTVQAQTQKELLEKIDKDINGLQTIIKMADTRIEITSATTKDFDPNDGFNFQKYSIANAPQNREALLEFFKKQNVESSLYYPYNLVSINKRENDLEKLLGYDHHSFSENKDQKVVYKPAKLEFLDGTKISSNLPIITNESIAKKHRIKEKEDDGKVYEYVSEEKMTAIEEKVWKGSSFDETIAITNAKPIKSVSYHIEVPIPSKKIFELNAKQKTAQTIYGTITLDTIVGNKVYCTIPDIDAPDVLQIEAYYKNGKILDKKGSSSNTVINDSKRKMYTSWISTLNTAKEQVKQGKIITNEALENYFKQHALKTNEQSKQSYKSTVYTFAGPVSKVAFVITDSVYTKEMFMLITN